jgi:oligosaccharyltransferase complex subunit alpha (ribophorin I)
MLPILSSLLLAGLAFAAPRSDAYINSAIARTVELGGATTSVTTQFNIKSLSDAPGEYHLALARSKGEEGPFWEISVGGKKVEGLQVDFIDGYVCACTAGGIKEMVD